MKLSNNLVDEYLAFLNLNSYIDRQLIKQSILDYIVFYEANKTKVKSKPMPEIFPTCTVFKKD